RSAPRRRSGSPAPAARTTAAKDDRRWVVKAFVGILRPNRYNPRPLFLGRRDVTQISDDLIAEMARRLVSELQAEKVILFGSRASGIAEPSSDVDLFVIVPKNHLSEQHQVVRAHR